MDRKCAEIQELLPWLENDSLDFIEKKPLLEHLSGCAECRRELAFIIEMKKAVLRTGSEPDCKLAGNLLNDMLERIIEENVQGSSIKSCSDVIIENIVKNPSPFGIMSAIANGVIGVIGDSTYETREKLKLVSKSMKLFDLYMQNSY